MERDEVLRLAREAGVFESVPLPQLLPLERFAALVAAAERIKHQAGIQRLTTLANTAEKWRGIAMARDGDGRTVQEVQAEAVAAEREACAKVCDEQASEPECPERAAYCAAAIRARK